MIESKNIISFIDALGHEDVDIRAEAVERIREAGLHAAPYLLAALQHENWLVRLHASKLLPACHYYSIGVMRKLQSALRQEKDEIVAETLLRALQALPFGDQQQEDSGEILEPMSDEQFFDGKQLEIPRFDLASILEIAAFLFSQGICFQLHKHAADSTCCPENISFLVEEAQFLKAIDLIKEFYGIDEQEIFSGPCPACGHEIENDARCPKCDLNLIGSSIGKNHPFMMFLQEVGLAKAENP